MSDEYLPVPPPRMGYRWGGRTWTAGELWMIGAAAEQTALADLPHLSNVIDSNGDVLTWRELLHKQGKPPLLELMAFGDNPLAGRVAMTVLP